MSRGGVSSLFILLAILLLPLASRSLSPFHRALIDRPPALVDREVPVPLLQHVVSLRDPLFQSSDRRELEVRFASLLEEPAREVRLLSAPLPKDLQLLSASPFDSYGNVDNSKEQLRGKKSFKRGKMRSSPKKGFGVSSLPPLGSSHPGLLPATGPVSHRRKCGASEALQAFLESMPGCHTSAVEVLETIDAQNASSIISRGLFPTKRVEAGEVLLRIPESLCLRQREGSCKGATVSNSEEPPPADFALAFQIIRLRQKLEGCIDMNEFCEIEEAHDRHLLELFFATLPSASALQCCGSFWTFEEIEQLEGPVLEAEMMWRLMEMEYFLKIQDIGEKAPPMRWEDLQWAVAIVRSRAVGGGGGKSPSGENASPMLVPLLDMCNHAPKELANAALCRLVDDSGESSKAIVATRTINAGTELLVVYETEALGGKDQQLGGPSVYGTNNFGATATSKSSNTRLASSLRSLQGVVPVGKLLESYGFLLERDVTTGVAFLPGELELEMASLTSAASLQASSLSPEIDDINSTMDGKNELRADLEAAMLLTTAMMEDFELLQADAQMKRQQHHGSATVAASDDNGMGASGELLLPLSPRLRLALLYRLGRTATVLQAFGEERRREKKTKRLVGR